MNNLGSKIFEIIERYSFIIFAVLAFLLYKRFSVALFGSAEAETKIREAAQEHEDSLTTRPKPIPPSASPAEKKRIANENLTRANRRLEATVAEEIWKWTDSTRFATPWTRKERLHAVAAQIKKYQCNYSGVIREYKALTKGRVLSDDLRYTLGDDYAKFITVASAKK